MNEIERYMEGTPETVARCIALARQRGQLVSARPLPAHRGQAAALVVLRDPRGLPGGKRRARSLRRWYVVGWLGGGALGLALLLGACLLVGRMFAEATEWVSAHARELLGGGVMVLIGLALLARIVGGGGSGHCSGPNSDH